MLSNFICLLIILENSLVFIKSLVFIYIILLYYDIYMCKICCLFIMYCIVLVNVLIFGLFEYVFNFIKFIYLDDNFEIFF